MYVKLFFSLFAVHMKYSCASRAKRSRLRNEVNSSLQLGHSLSLFTKLGECGDRFDDYLCLLCNFAWHEMTLSINKDNIHQNYYQIKAVYRQQTEKKPSSVKGRRRPPLHLLLSPSNLRGNPHINRSIKGGPRRLATICSARQIGRNVNI